MFIPAPEKSQYELERDERIKRNEQFLEFVFGVSSVLRIF